MCTLLRPKRMYSGGPLGGKADGQPLPTAAHYLWVYWCVLLKEGRSWWNMVFGSTGLYEAAVVMSGL
jgi:hypothetical protein